MVKPIFKLLALFLIILGLVLSFVYPILAIAGIPYYTYPPSQTTPDGIPLNVAWQPVQNIAVVENITVVGFWLGVYLTDDAVIQEEEGINIGIVRRMGSQWPDPEDNETKGVCLSIASADIPRGTPALVKATIVDVFTFKTGTRHCQFSPDTPNAEESFNLYADREYHLGAWATDIEEDFIIIDGLFWQWSNMDGPNPNWIASYRPPESTNRIYIPNNVFSFKMNVGTVDDDDDDGGVDIAPPPVLPPKDPSPDIQQVSDNPTIYFLGPLIFALGIGLLAHSMGWIDNKIILILLTILAFVLMFYLSNYVVV